MDSPPSPGEIVTISATSQDLTEGNTSGPISFELSDYQDRKYISVTPGGFGDGNDGDVNYAITHTVSSNQVSGNYTGLSAADIIVTNQNVDGIQSVKIAPASGIFVNEGGNVSISIGFVGSISNPGTQISIPFTVLDSSEAVLSSDIAVLNFSNLFNANINLSVPDDGVVDGDQAFTIVTGATSSNIPAFNNINPTDISGFTLDMNSPPPISKPVPIAQTWLLGTMAMLLWLFGLLREKRAYALLKTK